VLTRANLVISCRSQSHILSHEGFAEGHNRHFLQRTPVALFYNAFSRIQFPGRKEKSFILLREKWGCCPTGFFFFFIFSIYLILRSSLSDLKNVVAFRFPTFSRQPNGTLPVIYLFLLFLFVCVGLYRVGRGSLKPGDHIYSWRSAYIYAHHGSLSFSPVVLYFFELLCFCFTFCLV